LVLIASSGIVQIVMEYCDLGSLTELIKPKSMREKHIAFVASEILQALQYLHSLNRIHRDIKAENILVKSDGCLKLGIYFAHSTCTLLVVVVVVCLCVFVVLTINVQRISA
jgi:serine/threonine protein kinase